MFVAIVSRHTLNSVACKRELEWALVLSKPVLPLAVERLPDALPRTLSMRHIVDYSTSGREAAFALAGALGTLPPAPSPPKQLPKPPATPLSYLSDLVEQVAQPEPLTHDQQRQILIQLQPALSSADTEERRGGRFVLEMFSKRNDLYADVDRTLAQSELVDRDTHPPTAPEVSAERGDQHAPTTPAAAIEDQGASPALDVRDQHSSKRSSPPDEPSTNSEYRAASYWKKHWVWLAGGLLTTAMVVALVAWAVTSDHNKVQQIFPIGVERCDPPPKQLCTPIPSVAVPTGDQYLTVEFIASPNGCSDMIAHVIVDGREWGSDRLGPGQGTLGLANEVGSRTHTVGVQAEGIEGGCNTGYLSSWTGTLHISIE